MSPPGSNLLAGTLAYLVASVFWGLNIPLTAKMLESFDPFWVSPCRYVIASVLLGVWVAFSLGPSKLLSPIPLWRIACLSLAVATFLVLFNLGLYTTHPITAAAVIAGSLVYVAVVFRFMTGASLERGFWGATLLTLVGAGIAIYGRTGMGPAGGSGLPSGLSMQGGEILLVLAIASWTVYSVLAQRWFKPETTQLQRSFLSSLGAIPWLLAYWLLALSVGLVGAPNLDPSGEALLYLVITAVCATALATVAWNTGVARLGIQAGGMWQNTVPVFAVLISLLLFGVVPSLAQIAGGAIVMTGVLYMQWHRWQAARHAGL